MKKNDFKAVSADKYNPKYGELTRRENGLYSEEGEVRSEFARDYTRVLHCTAYRRLKHKTQVFYNIENDHTARAWNTCCTWNRRHTRLQSG